MLYRPWGDVEPQEALSLLSLLDLPVPVIDALAPILPDGIHSDVAVGGVAHERRRRGVDRDVYSMCVCGGGGVTRWAKPRDLVKHVARRRPLWRCRWWRSIALTKPLC